MYKKALVLLDGSKLAEVVFTYAQELSARLNMDLDLLHVCSHQDAEQLPMRQAYMDHMAEILQNKCTEISSKIGVATTQKSIKAQGKVVVGYPAEEILKYADANNIDLIMLSTHGRSGARIWDLGSVADKVIHAAKVPIWLVPTELSEAIIWDTLPKRTVVIPLDGSKLSAGVIPYVIALVRQRGAQLGELVLIYVDDYTTTLVISEIQLKQLEDRRLSMKKYLDYQVQLINKEGVTAHAEMLRGDPTSTIIDFLKNNPSTLLAMSTHGHSGIRGMVFDSITEEILHLVKETPIFIARPSE